MEVWGSGQPVGGESTSTQLDRIEAMLKTLLAKKKTKPRSKDWVYPDWFKSVWEAYPKRAGSNPKKKAYYAINARCVSGHVPVQAMQGLLRYADFCKATGKTGTEYVMQAATFFGPDKHYENDWTIPTQKETTPRDNNKLVQWAQDKGFRPPLTGEEYPQYRIALERLMRRE